MIDILNISGFKSIRKLSMDCKRVNVFIGRPGTGKSNLLEALGMFSFLYYGYLGYKARDFIRFERTSNLFHDEWLDSTIGIRCGELIMRLEFMNGEFSGVCSTGEEVRGGFLGSYDDFERNPSPFRNEPLAPFKSYRFRVNSNFNLHQSDSLLPPYGDNLLSLLLVDRELRSVVNQPFSSMGLRLGIRPQEGKLEVIKSVDDVIISYPYSLTSETLQRLTFYMAAILSNKDSILIFEEPESHAFPYYTKYLAEVIALDQQNNQYFISTHNPYFLLPLLEKSPKNEISINIVYYEDYETKVKTLTYDDMEELAEIDVFSNLERFLEEG
jgi:predicted ATPase